MIGLVVLAVMALVGPGVAVVVFFVVADTKTVVPELAAKTLTNAVLEENGYTPTAVSCPSGVELKVGATFNCHFNSPVGPQTARMQVTEVDGDGVPTYDMSWGPG